MENQISIIVIILKTGVLKLKILL